MRKLTLLLSLVLVLMMAFCAFFYTGGTLRASASRMDAPASDYPAEFALVQETLANGSVPALYSSEALGDASGYTLVGINVSLTNPGLFAAEWLNVQPVGLQGDVAVYALEGDGSDVAARGVGQVSLRLLTRAPANTPRQLRIQYYVYGISRTITVDV